MTAAPATDGLARTGGPPFRSDIQGLRAFAVLAVVLYHAGVPWMSGGYVGVDVFFVISGFLITSHLLTGLARDGRIHFSAFYAKRVRRILPASFVVLISSVLAACVWVPPLLMEEVWRGAVATALYIPNVLFAIEGTNYLAETTPSLFQHYWSLGLEEQFYLVWPLVLVLAWRWSRTRRALFAVLLTLVLASAALCVVMTFWKQPWAFFLLPSRAWEFGVGGLLAFALVRKVPVIPTGVAAAAGWIGMAAMIAPVFAFSSDTPFPGYWAAIPVIGTALVILAGGSPGRFAPSRVLALRPLVFVGAISYSLYLIHWPALLLPQLAVSGAEGLPLLVSLSIAALCVPAAWVLYRFVEAPARGSRRLTQAPPRRTLMAAVASTGVAITVATAVFASSGTRPLHAEETAEAPSMSVLPIGTSFVPSNLKPALTAASDDRPVVYDDGCHQSVSGIELPACLYGALGGPRIVLFGDSHAAQWLPALQAFAEEHGYTIESRTKSSCPSTMMPVTVNAVPYSECDVWREKVLSSIEADPPALVVMSNYTEYDASSAEAWGGALEKTLDRISAPSIVIADTPAMGATPAVCLSAHLADADRCGRPRGDATNSEMARAEHAAATAADVTYVDLTDYFCAETTCSPILGDTLVYRDDHHITTRFARLLGAVLQPQLVASLAR